MASNYRAIMERKAFDAVCTIVNANKTSAGEAGAELITELLMAGVSPRLLDSAVNKVRNGN